MHMSRIFLLFFLAAVFSAYTSCGFGAEDGSERILDMYAQIVQAFDKEDLHGVMQYVSKDFESEIEDQATYDEVREFRRIFILENHNVSVDFRNINIEIDGSKAVVSYDMHVTSSKMEDTWSQRDVLNKKFGGWEIVHSIIIEKS